MNKKNISKQFASDLDKLMEGSQIDSTLFLDENYKENIELAHLFINDLPKSSVVHKERIKSKIFEQADKKQSIWHQIGENIYFSLIGSKKRTITATVSLGLCVLLLFPGTTTLGKNTVHFIREIIASYQLGNHTMVQQIAYDKSQVEQFSDLTTPLDMWIYSVRIGNYGGNLRPGQSSEMQTFKTLEEGKNTLSFTLKTPSYMPAGSNLSKMVVSPSEQVFLIYNTPKGEIDIVQTSETDATSNFMSTDGKTESILIDGKEAVWCEDDKFLIWEENNSSFSLGGDISQDEAIKIANSIE